MFPNKVVMVCNVEFVNNFVVAIITNEGTVYFVDYIKARVL